MPLGTSGMTVLDQATGYGVFMSGGMETNRHTIVQITDAAGNKLFDFKENAAPAKRVLSEKATKSINVILSQVPEWGTGRRSKLAGIKTAGKTGTTQAYRDAWFVGYTGNYTAAVWFGNDDYSPTNRLTGGRLPAMTWNRFMTYAHQNIDLKPIPFVGKQKPTDKIRPAPVAKDAPPIVAVVRQKPLPQATANLLRELERDLRAAPPLKPKTLASRTSNTSNRGSSN